MDAQGASGPRARGDALPVSRALVVEDDASLCRTLVSALEHWAVETRSANDLAEARRELADFRPELLVIDFMLPDGTAAELLADVVVVTPLPAIVAMSAFAEPRD